MNKLQQLKEYLADLIEKWQEPVLKRAKDAEKEIDAFAKELIMLFENDLAHNKPIFYDSMIINYARISDYQRFNNDLVKNKVISYYKNKGRWKEVTINENEFLYSHKELVLELKINAKK